MHVLKLPKWIWEDWQGEITSQLLSWFRNWTCVPDAYQSTIDLYVEPEDCLKSAEMSFDLVVGRHERKIYRVFNPAGWGPPQPAKRKVLLLLNH